MAFSTTASKIPCPLCGQKLERDFIDDYFLCQCGARIPAFDLINAIAMGTRVDWDRFMSRFRPQWMWCDGCGDVFNAVVDPHHCINNQRLSILHAIMLEESFYMTTQQANVRIWWDTSVSAYRMSSPFNRELVDAIRAFVPVSDRSYDPTSKIWTFVERQLAPLQDLLKKLGCNAVVVTRAQAEQAQQSSSNPSVQRGRPIADVCIEFMRLAGNDAMLKAYRHAAMLNHPDRGGDMSKMSALNAAWDRLQKELYSGQ